MKAAATRVAPVPDADASLRIAALEQLVAAQGQQLTVLTARVVQLEASAPKDAADVEFQSQLYRLTAQANDQVLMFKPQDLLEHVKTDAELRHALLAIDCVTTRDIGCWLRDHVGVRDGLRIERVGRKWKCTLCT